MEKKTLLLLLGVLASPSAVLTENQIYALLELSGLVTNANALTAVHFAAGLGSASTPASLLGFVGILKGLAQINPQYAPADSAKLDAYVAQVATSGTDVPLTFGILLPLLGALLNGPARQSKPRAAATRRRSRR